MQILLTSVLIVLIIVAILQAVSMVMQSLHHSRRQEIDRERQTIFEELGAIKNVAAEVDRFKRLFENTKAKGALGEFVLESILQQFLIPGQYESQAAIKGKERVDFAIRIPSNEDVNKYVILPVDSKFKLADYERLMESYDLQETQDPESLKRQIEACEKALKASILNEAKNITKYIHPPKTTSFAILFLPNDKMMIEALNIKGLFEEMYERYNILLTGPSTLAAFLSSLQMGFRHIALDKRGPEIVGMYNAMKVGIGEFDTALLKVRESLRTALKKVDAAEHNVSRFKAKLKKIEVFVCKEPLIADESGTETYFQTSKEPQSFERAVGE